jgi:cytochrome c peroxidase
MSDGAAASKAKPNPAGGAPKSGGGGGGMMPIILGLAAGGGLYYAWQEGWLNDYLPAGTGGAASGGSPAADKVATEVAPKVRKAIEAILEDNDNMGPTLVRLAWHASGTYAKGGSPAGGSDGGRIRFGPEASDGANAGLDKMRALLEPIHAANPSMSYADLYAYSGAVAIEFMGGPHIPFQFGRSDYRSEEEVKSAGQAVPNGRLPDASKGSDHIRDVFYRMGFNDKEIVALSGAHTLGRCHTDRSGYSGPWTFAPTTLSNQYFDLLNNEIEKPGYWREKKWSGPKQYEDPTGELMMLPTDMALVWDDKFRPIVQTYAKDEGAFFKDFSGAFSKLLHLGCDKSKLSKAV